MPDRLSYTVTVTDFFGTPTGPACRPVALFEGVSLVRAWRIVRRHARRGVTLFSGNDIQFDNWGARGGRGLQAYRSACIRLTTV